MSPYDPDYVIDKSKSKEQLILEISELRNQLAAGNAYCTSLLKELDSLKGSSPAQSRIIQSDEPNQPVKTCDMHQDISECRLALDELSRQKEILQKIFDHLPVMICFVGEDGSIKMVNRKWQSTLGWSLEETCRKDILALCYPDHNYRNRVIEFISQSNAEWGDFKTTIREGRMIDTAWANVKLSDGTSIGIGQDITDRKQAEEALRQSQDLLSTIIDSISAPVFYKDLQGIYIGCNKAFAESLGLPKEAIVGKTVFDIRLGDHAQHYHQADLKLLETGDTQIYETEYVKADGSNLQSMVHKSPWRGQDGEIKGIVGVMVDIRELKGAEQELLKKEKRFRELAEMLPEGIFETDRHMNLTFANQKAFEIFGYSSKDLENGLNGFDIIAPEDRQRAHARVAERIQNKNFAINEYRGMKKDGAVFPVLFHLKPILNEDAVVGFRGVVVDITERKKMEERLIQAQKMESIGNLAGGIAHDFNNLLFPIIGNCELLLEDLPPDSPEYESVQQIHLAGQRGSALVKQILAFSRQSDHRVKPVRIQKIMAEVLKLVRSTIPSSIEIISELQGDCGLVLADPTHIHQVAMNLITNAYHAVEQKGGIITIQLKETTLNSAQSAETGLCLGKYAALIVSDAGCGIDPSIRNRIFDPYFTTKPQGKGTGLGLAVAHGIVKDYRGDIKVNSEPGKGSVFVVYLPLIEKLSDNLADINNCSLPTGKEHILLVDDEAPIARLQKQILERLGYRVTCRISSIDALEAFRSKPDDFDLVITDMAMPNMTGDCLASELIAIKPDIPVIICTGFSENIDSETAAAKGIKGYLMKPVARFELAQMVRKTIEEVKG